MHGGVLDAGDDDRVATGEAGEDREQVARRADRVQSGEQHDEGPGGRHTVDHAGDGGPVRRTEARFDGREDLAEPLHDVRPGGAADAVADGVVEDHEVDAVTGRGREGAEQQRRLDERVEARFVLDPTGSGAPGVDDHHDPAVALRSPGPDDQVLPTRGRPPVDRPDVVTPDVVAERVELGAVTAELQGRLTVELAQSGEPGRQVSAGPERRGDDERPRCRQDPLPGGEAEGPDRPHRDPGRGATAATERREPHPRGPAFPRRHVEAEAARLLSGRRLPHVAELGAEPTGAVVRDDERAVRGGVPPGGAGHPPLDAESPRVGGEDDVECRADHDDRHPGEPRPAAAEQHRRDDGDGEQDDEPTGDRH